MTSQGSLKDRKPPKRQDWLQARLKGHKEKLTNLYLNDGLRKVQKKKKNCFGPSGTYSTGQVNHSARIPLSCHSLIEDKTEAECFGKKKQDVEIAVY